MVNRPLPPNYDAFRDSLREAAPPANWPAGLQALWHWGKGDWETAHAIAQDMPGVTGSWIHGYLHRVEGDRWNAGYWYDRAGRPFPNTSPEGEFEELARYLLRT